MKHAYGTLSTGGLLLITGLLQPCLAETSTPRIEQRQENQDRRIERGVESGALTQREANRLNHQQMRIEHQEAAAMADGSISNAERARLTHQQNKASHAIARKNHNLRH